MNPPAPTEAHPTTGIMAAMGGAPVAPAAPQPPAPPVPVSDDVVPQQPAQTPAPTPAPAPASASVPEFERPTENAPAAAPAEEAQRMVRPAPPSFRDGGLSDEQPQAPVIRPVPSSPAAAGTTADVHTAAVVPPADAAPAPAVEEPVPAPLAMPFGGLAADVDKTVVTPRPTHDVDEDLDATVVVARKRGVRRSLVLDDGRKFSLSGASVVIGRNPIGEPGEQRLAISDTTRTLSKTHARLVVHDDEWRLTDLHATNGVVVVEENGTETLLDPGESVTGNGRFILGEVGMHVIAERDS